LPVGSSYAGLGDYVRGGTQTNTGISLGGQSSPAYALRLEGSLAFLIARASGTGMPGYDGVQVQNIPRLGGFVQATYALPKMPVELYVSSTQRGRRNARADGLASVPGYTIFDAGADWHGTVSGKSVVVALRVSNLIDRRYWRDVGEAYSADLLFPGASRSIAVSARLEF
jgi:iron complex outermembrane receptor protein